MANRYGCRMPTIQRTDTVKKKGCSKRIEEFGFARSNAKFKGSPLYRLSFFITLNILTLLLAWGITGRMSFGIAWFALTLNILIVLVLDFFKPKFILIECGQGYCRHCSYNLTGIDSERCPECGHRIEQLGTRIKGT